MSKTAEQKALEAYPFEPIECGGGIADSNSEYRGLYQEGYDQATQDFLEKAEEFLYFQINNGSIECGNIERLIDDFKNYMQNEM